MLRVLADGPTYGYAIAAALEEGGIGTVKGGTLYPLLTRFEAAQWVQVEWRAGDGGPGRKYYTLTSAGRAEQLRQAREWATFAQVTANFVDPQRASDPGGSPDPVTTEGHTPSGDENLASAGRTGHES